MRNTKRKLLIVSLLVLSLMFSACGKDKNINKLPEENKAKVQDFKGKDKDSVENEELNVDEKNNDEEENNKVDKELLKELNDEADYISRIKVQVATDSKPQINFIEDYKGDLANIDMEIPYKSLNPGSEYIIFYKDGVDGKIGPISKDNAFIEITGSDDGNLNYIEAHYTNMNMPSQNENSDKNSNDKSSKGDK